MHTQWHWGKLLLLVTVGANAECSKLVSHLDMCVNMHQHAALNSAEAQHTSCFCCKLLWQHEQNCRRKQVCSCSGFVPYRNHIIQYHEVIGSLMGSWGERAALFFNVVSLLGLAVVQIIACASDAYYLYDGLNKR